MSELLFERMTIYPPIYMLIKEPIGIKLQEDAIKYLKLFHPEIFHIRKFDELIKYCWNIEHVQTPIDKDGNAYYLEQDIFLDWISYIYGKYP